MTAYRLHFAKPNLEAIKLVQAGGIGQPRIFNSLFTMQIKAGNIRLKKELGGGPLYDIGIYCINAARYLFRAEPTEVFAFSANNHERRFRQVDEMISAVLRFPEERLATFTCSFGAADTSVYDIIGTKGVLRLNQAYEYASRVDLELRVAGKTTKRTYACHDQFAPELIYFSDCILRDVEPEPSGIEGLIDVHIIRSLGEAARMGRPVKLGELRRQRRPTRRLQISRPPVGNPAEVHAEGPSKN